MGVVHMGVADMYGSGTYGSGKYRSSPLVQPRIEHVKYACTHK